MATINLGIRVASVKSNGPVPGFRLAEVFCVETGETISGVHVISLEYDTNGVVGAKLSVWPCEIIGTDQPLFATFPQTGDIDEKYTR